jgi:hypothetical protein
MRTLYNSIHLGLDNTHIQLAIARSAEMHVPQDVQVCWGPQLLQQL